MAVRTLSPDVIICDEIGQKDEIDEMLIGMNSGVKFILTIHATSFIELKRKPAYKNLFIESGFNNIVLCGGLSKNLICRIETPHPFILWK